MTFFFVRHKREAVAEFSFCNGSFLSGIRVSSFALCNLSVSVGVL